MCSHACTRAPLVSPRSECKKSRKENENREHKDAKWRKFSLLFVSSSTFWFCFALATTPVLGQFVPFAWAGACVRLLRPGITFRFRFDSAPIHLTSDTVGTHSTQHTAQRIQRVFCVFATSTNESATLFGDFIFSATIYSRFVCNALIRSRRHLRRIAHSSHIASVFSCRRSPKRKWCFSHLLFSFWVQNFVSNPCQCVCCTTNQPASQRLLYVRAK